MAARYRGRTFRCPAGSVPAGMVAAPSNLRGSDPDDIMPLPDYFLDKFEVTNRQFKQFVDAGGYRESKYWRHPFRKDGRDISFEEAMPLLRDATGRPGPSGWELGAFPQEPGGLSRLRRELVRGRRVLRVSR